ncbi:outer membrane protein assembly factor BamB family protein [Tautonia rosea]|uniref:outer membrane protein assembly factor BamB family protein n=1 Tax=Tautonia rosea TaxID=2728037 RepID=UPI0014752546|nr:PQQ-binding-like beta-propeller repeat protein [Tautonia rosea]
MYSHAPGLSALFRLSRVRFPATLILSVVSIGILPAQGVQRLASTIYPETSSAAEALLKTAASHVRQQQWDSAVELYQRAIQQFPEALTLAESLDGGADQEEPGVAVFVNVSEYAQRRIALLPPEALQLYRNRVDAQARHLFEQGRDQFDPIPLRRVVDAFFSSSFGDDATELLADLAFQEGRFDEALGLYRRLIPPSDAAQTGSIYPDPDIDIARVAAKLILCNEAIGQRSGNADLQSFEESYPDATGELAGRRGNYAEIVTSALEQDQLRLPTSLDSRWPTFAGASSRSKALTEPVDPGALVWSIPLRTPFDSSANLAASPRRFGQDFGMPEDDFPSFFPVLEGDEVFLTDGHSVLGYPLEGSPEGIAVPAPSWRAAPPPSAPSAAQPTFGIERHTLTVFDGRIYARLGPYGAAFQGRNMSTAPPTAIIALDRSRPDSPLWIQTADQVMAGPGQENQGALTGQVAFGGAPIVDEHGVYVALLKPGTQALTWVACLDPDSGQTRWVRYVCSGTSASFSRVPGARNRGMIVNPELGHRLLTLGGSTIYYQTDLGALASIDAQSGRINWLASYPRRMAGVTGLATPVTHNPAIVHGNTVIVAPEDTDRVLAFDRSSGLLVWESNPGGRVTHLLGVASGNLVVTGNHVWTIDIEDGSIRSRWPEGQTLEQGYGRGLLAGGEIYWPTRDTLYILDQMTGRPTDRPPIALRESFGCGGGNLVAGDGYLLIAERDHLRVFCKPTRMLRYYRERIAEEPKKPDLYYRLARTAEALGHDQEALDSLDRVVELASPSDRIDGRRLLDATRAERFKIFLKLATESLSQGDPRSASERLEQAIATAPGDQARIEAELALADARHEMGDSAGAVEVLQTALSRPEVRQIDLPADEHRSLRAELLLVDRLRWLIQESGPERYARFEAEASELFRKGRANDDLRQLEEVVLRYPASRHVPDALEAIGTLSEQRGDWSEAARAYHQLLVSASEDSQRARGLLGIARCYEAIDLNTEAREAYLLADSRYGSLKVELSGTVSSIDSYVNDRLASKEELLRMRTQVIEPPLGPLDPFFWPSEFAPLPIDDPTTRPLFGDDWPDVLMGQGQLQGIDPETGKSVWEWELVARPSWSGIAGGHLILATSDQIVGFDLIAGKPLWDVHSQDGELAFGPPPPQMRAEANRREAPSSSGFQGFRLHGDRLYFLRGDRELVCLDPIAGRPLWTYRTSAISMDSHLGLGLSRVVIQSRMPNAMIVLDARDGRTLGMFPQEESAGPWRRDPHAVALDRVAIVPDGSSVVLMDLESGQAIWEAREPSPLPSSPRPSPSDPLVLGDFERLLVLRGETLQRLDPTNGKVLWSTKLGRFRSDRRNESIVLGSDAVYVMGQKGPGLSVSALSLRDGERNWGVSLPGDLNETWGLELTADCVLVYRLGDGTPGTTSNTPVVLNLLGRASGQRVQRLVVDGAGAGRTVRLHSDGISVAGDLGMVRLSGWKPQEPQATLRDLSAP